MQRDFGLPERGAVLPLVAICLAVLMGFAGMAVDIGYLEYQQEVQQSATDAAAMGGAQEAYADSCDNAADASAAAVADAALNGYPSQYVQATSPPSSGPYAGVSCAVAVTINKTKPTFFSQILGFNGMKESTQAVGVASLGTSSGCIWLLTTSQQSNLSNTDMQVPHCAIYINDSANMSNSTINASYIGYNTGVNNTSNTSFTNATPQPMGLVSDPCSTFSGCQWLTNNKPAAGECDNDENQSNASVGTATSTLCFRNFSLTGTDTVCGLIEVTGTQLHLQGATVTSCSAGVTFALSSTVSDINFSTASLNLSAPISGNSAEMLFWRDPAQSNSVNYSNCTCWLTGMLYYPTTQVDYSSASGDYALLVFGQANFSTSTGLAIGTPAPGYGSGPKAALGE